MRILEQTENLTVSTTLKGSLPYLRKLPFADIKNDALGKSYDLSVNFIGNKLSRTLNKKYRNINKPTDILSFPLDVQSGEMFICIEASRKKAFEFERSFENYLAFLFIHGLVHLKGYDHGSRMEDIEKRMRQKFRV